MKISIVTELEINEAIISRAADDFIEDYGYRADKIKSVYLDYVLNRASKHTEDDVLDYLEEKMDPDDKEYILFTFAKKFEEALHQDVEKAITKDC